MKKYFYNNDFFPSNSWLEIPTDMKGSQSSIARHENFLKKTITSDIRHRQGGIMACFDLLFRSLLTNTHILAFIQSEHLSTYSAHTQPYNDNQAQIYNGLNFITSSSSLVSIYTIIISYFTSQFIFKPFHSFLLIPYSDLYVLVISKIINLTPTYTFLFLVRS